MAVFPLGTINFPVVYGTEFIAHFEPIISNRTLCANYYSTS